MELFVIFAAAVAFELVLLLLLLRAAFEADMARQPYGCPTAAGESSLPCRWLARKPKRLTEGLETAELDWVDKCEAAVLVPVPAPSLRFDDDADAATAFGVMVIGVTRVLPIDAEDRRGELVVLVAGRDPVAALWPPVLPLVLPTAGTGVLGSTLGRATMEEVTGAVLVVAALAAELALPLLLLLPDNMLLAVPG